MKSLEVGSNDIRTQCRNKEKNSVPDFLRQTKFNYTNFRRDFTGGGFLQRADFHTFKAPIKARNYYTFLSQLPEKPKGFVWGKLLMYFCPPVRTSSELRGITIEVKMEARSRICVKLSKRLPSRFGISSLGYVNNFPKIENIVLIVSR